MRTVLDSSALYLGKDLPEGGEFHVPPSVVSELRRHGLGMRLEYLLASRLSVSSPSPASLARVAAAAEETGDSGRLSPTDRDVLALALDLDAELVTDDYSIQNVADLLQVPIRSMEERGIRERFTWRYRCSGCSKLFERPQPRCDVCGAPVRSVRRR